MRPSTLAIVAIGPAAALAGSPSSLPAPAADLDALLPRLSRVADLFRDGALSFACRETIAWSEPFGSNGRQSFGYVFVYSDAAGFEDHRTWGRGRSARKVEDGEIRAPLFLKSSYLWAFNFREARHDRFHYEIVGSDTVLGRPAVGVRFEPLPPIEEKVNDWYGIAWTDRKTAQFLRVEAYEPDDWAVKRAFETHMAGGPRRGEHYDFARYVTDFTVERNGMRFPGRIVIRRSRYTPFLRQGAMRYEETTLLEVRQTYRRYEFYSVRTAEEISRIVTGAVTGRE